MIEFQYEGIYKVISGGQTGADQAGLAVGRAFGLETGGHIARGYRTTFGSMPELEIYGLTVHSSYDYPPRTKENAKNSDATVRLASNFNSAGEKLTLKYARSLNKPVFDVLLDGKDYDKKAADLAAFIKQHAVRVLNVAGNADRDKRMGKHFFDAQTVLTLAFNILKQEGLLKQRT